MKYGKRIRKDSLPTTRKPWHDYFIEDKIEAGIELVGTEVKSIRHGTLQY